MEVPEKKYFRLFPGNEVRFKGAYFITCNEVVKDADGKVTELRCTYDPATRSGSGFEGRKVKGTIQWVDAATAVPVTVRLYGYLMVEGENGENVLNPDSLRIAEAMAEPSLAEAAPGERFQFLRQGYYVADSELSTAEHKVFNQIVDLKSSYKGKDPVWTPLRNTTAATGSSVTRWERSRWKRAGFGGRRPSGAWNTSASGWRPCPGRSCRPSPC